MAIKIMINPRIPATDPTIATMLSWELLEEFWGSIVTGTLSSFPIVGVGLGVTLAVWENDVVDEDVAVLDGVGVFDGVFDSEDPGERELVGDGVPVPVPVRVLVGVRLGVLDGPGNKQ